MKKRFKFEYRITFLYIVIGLLWIFLTDAILEFLISDKQVLSTFQSYKGAFYVVITSLFLFILIHRYTQKEEEVKKRLIESKEKAEESDRLKSAFLANMSHEIRTPMNGILGFVSLLDDVTLTKEKYLIYVNLVKKSSERLLETINDIIEISKIESNQVSLKKSQFDVNESLNYLYGFFKPAAEEKNLNLKLVNSLSDNTVVFNTDKNKFESILTNFIKNAIKFTNEGFIEIGFNRTNGSYLFYVKDTGSGIPKEKQEVIFERFVQADIEITRPYEGSGLGLSIAKAYAGMLGGKIGIESEEGKGSTFNFTLNGVAVTVSEASETSVVSG
ncbi:MAG: sensor histidine kinase [Bacteroidota bacterium]